MISITILLKRILMLIVIYWHRQSYLWNVYEEFFKRKDLFDFSDSKLFDETNKTVIGKMKDESGELM